MYLTISTGLGELAGKRILDNLDVLAKMPINRFELFGFPTHFNIRDSAEIRKLIQAGKARDFMWESIHAPAWGGPYDLSSLDENERREAVRWNAAAINAIGELGGRYCVTHAGDRIENPLDRPKRLAQSARSFADLIPIAEKQHITIALENILDPYAPGSLAETKALMKDVESKWFRPIFDVAHAFLSDGLDVWYEQIAKLQWNLIAVHATDNHGRVRNTSSDDEHLFPFCGIIPWDDVFKQVRRLGFDGPVTIECAINNDLLPRFESLVVGEP